jgi:hypothetical protein
MHESGEFPPAFEDDFPDLPIPKLPNENVYIPAVARLRDQIDHATHSLQQEKNELALAKLQFEHEKTIPQNFSHSETCDIIELNIGGKLFTTSRQTIEDGLPGSFLASLVSGRYASLPFVCYVAKMYANACVCVVCMKTNFHLSVHSGGRRDSLETKTV